MTSRTIRPHREDNEDEGKAGFDTGEIVQLKSGGPKMTVASTNTKALAAPMAQGRIHCQWFAGSKLEQGFFPPEALVKVQSEPKKEG